MNNNLKPYLNWIIIGVIIFGGGIFYWLYVGALERKAAKEHKEVVDKDRMFKDRFNRTKEGLLQTPTQSDLKIGDEFMESIKEERQKVLTLLKRFAIYWDQNVVDGEVVYPQGTIIDNVAKEGTKVDEMTFTDFLSEQYLKAMATMENEIFHAGTKNWEAMLQQSIYATSPNIANRDDGKIVHKAKNSAGPIAAAQARILDPLTMIPFKMDDKFRGADKKQKRLLAWRQLLIFRDIITRVVPHTRVEVERDVIGFERVKKEAEGFEMPPTKIESGKSLRFIQNISQLNITLESIGDAVIPEKELAILTKKDADEDKDASSSAEDKLSENGQYFDRYKISISLVGHLRVVEAFQKLLLDSNDLYYVPIAASYERFADRETMGGYVMPNEGALAVDVSPTEEFKNSKAYVPNVIGDYSYEPPVKAHLEYWLYRPRFSGAANPDADMEEDNSAAGE